MRCVMGAAARLQHRDVLGLEFSLDEFAHRHNRLGRAHVRIEPGKMIFPCQPTRFFLSERLLPRAPVGRSNYDRLAPAIFRIAFAINLILTPAKFPPSALLVKITLLLQTTTTHLLISSMENQIIK